MGDAEMWKAISDKLAVALSECLDIGLAQQATERGEYERTEVERDAWRVFKEWEKAHGFG